MWYTVTARPWSVLFPSANNFIYQTIKHHTFYPFIVPFSVVEYSWDKLVILSHTFPLLSWNEKACHVTEEPQIVKYPESSTVTQVGGKTCECEPCKPKGINTSRLKSWTWNRWPQSGNKPITGQEWKSKQMPKAYAVCCHENHNMKEAPWYCELWEMVQPCIKTRRVLFFSVSTERMNVRILWHDSSRKWQNDVSYKFLNFSSKWEANQDEQSICGCLYF